MRKVITKTLNYIASSWGIMDEGGKIIAYVNYLPKETNDYSTYGDDADVYEEFEADGFVKTKEVKSYAEAYAWLKENAEDEIAK